MTSLVPLGLAGFVGWPLFGAWFDGEISIPRVDTKANRKRDPITFWALVALYGALSAMFVGIAVVFFIRGVE